MARTRIRDISVLSVTYDVVEEAGKLWEEEGRKTKSKADPRTWRVMRHKADPVIYGSHKVSLWDRDKKTHFGSPVLDLIGKASGQEFELVVHLSEPEIKAKIKRDLEDIANGKIDISKDPKVKEALQPLLAAIRPRDPAPQMQFESGTLTSLFGVSPRSR